MADYNKGACTTVAKGGVGESGASLFLYHHVTAGTSKMMVLRNVKTSLCANTGAIAVLVVNGIPVAHGTITELGSSIQGEANAGDHVAAIVHTIPLFNEIACVRLGELSVELDECELVA